MEHSKMKEIWSLLKKMPNWAKTVIILAIAAIAIVASMCSCSVQHKVVQSAYNTATGDSIIIKYEQIGKGIKGM